MGKRFYSLKKERLENNLKVTSLHAKVQYYGRYKKIDPNHKKNRLHNKQVSFKVAKEEAQMDETRASLVAQKVKNLLAMQETQVRSLDQKIPVEKEMATHPSILAWSIPRTEKPGGLRSMRSQTFRHN